MFLLYVIFQIGILILLLYFAVQLYYSFLCPLYITDYAGNLSRGLIRYGETIPNNGMLYRYKNRIMREISDEEKWNWIADNRELYVDIIEQQHSRGKYKDIKVRIR